MNFMKKAKVMLTAITISALLGGLLAFKVQKGLKNGNLFCTTRNGDIATSTIPYVVDPLGTIVYCTLVHGSRATITYRVSQNP